MKKLIGMCLFLSMNVYAELDFSKVEGEYLLEGKDGRTFEASIEKDEDEIFGDELVLTDQLTGFSMNYPLTKACTLNKTIEDSYAFILFTLAEDYQYCITSIKKNTLKGKATIRHYREVLLVDLDDDETSPLMDYEMIIEKNSLAISVTYPGHDADSLKLIRIQD